MKMGTTTMFLNCCGSHSSTRERYSLRIVFILLVEADPGRGLNLRHRFSLPGFENFGADLADRFRRRNVPVDYIDHDGEMLVHHDQVHPEHSLEHFLLQVPFRIGAGRMKPELALG